jgi:tetratricopeptide (TPR) repeat protein
MMIRFTTYCCCCFIGLLVLSCGGNENQKDLETTPELDGIGTDPGLVRVSEAIQVEPQRADLYASRAQMWYDKKNYDNAILDLRNAVILDSINLEYHYLLTDVYLDYFQSRLALKTIQRAVKLDPDNIESLLTQAEVELTLQQYEDALKTLNEVIRLDLRNPDAYLLLGQTFAETGDTARAINSTQEAVEIAPDLIDGWIILGRLHARIGTDLAERYFATAMTIDTSDISAIHAKADFYRDRGELRKAIDLYQKTTRIDRQYVAGHYNAGLLFMELGEIENARNEFSITVKNDPLHIRGYFFLGYAHEQLGNPEEAFKNYNTALRFAPDYQLPKDGLARLAQ